MSTASIDWAVSPYQGVGPLRFGMSPQEVAEHIGPSDEIQTREPFSRQARKRGAGRPFIEFRLDPATGLARRTLPAAHYDEGRLVMLEFLRSATALRLDDLLLFDGERQALIDRLIAQGDTVFEGFEGYFFLDAGLAMLSAENAQGSVDNGNGNIGVYGDPALFDTAIREDLEHDMGRFLKGAPA